MSNEESRYGEREGEYEGLVRRFEREGRYEGREEEVAARIVNKQRREFGETREARDEDERGESPDRDLPIEQYDLLTVDEVSERLDDLPDERVREVKAYEEGHKRRETLLKEMDRELGG